MKKSLLTLLLPLTFLPNCALAQSGEVTISLSKRISAEDPESFRAMPIVPVSDEYLSMETNGDFTPIQLSIPEKELPFDNGIIETYFTGGTNSSKILMLVSDYKSRSPRFYVDHNQNGNFKDDGPFIELTGNKTQIALSNKTHPNGQYLIQLERLKIVNQKSRDNLKRNIKRIYKYSKAELSEPDFWFRGILFNVLSWDVDFRGTKFQIGLMDATKNGLYNDGEDRVLIGKYGSDRMTADLNDNNYLVGDNSPFAVGNKGFKITNIDITGKSISFTPIDYSNVPSKLKIGDQLPKATVESINEEPISLIELIELGKYNYLDFWGVWCKGCIDAIPTIRKISSQYKDKLKVIGLHSGRITQSKLNNFIEQRRMDWTQVRSTEEVERLLKVSTFPYGILIDPKGEIVAFNVHIDQLEKWLNK